MPKRTPPMSATKVVRKRGFQKVPDKRNKTFPEDFHDYCTKVSKKHPDIISWSSDGAYVNLHIDHNIFALFFEDHFGKNATYEKLATQLHEHGFLNGHSLESWHHPFFHQKLSECKLDEIVQVNRELKCQEPDVSTGDKESASRKDNKSTDHSSTKENKKKTWKTVNRTRECDGTGGVEDDSSKDDKSKDLTSTIENKRKGRKTVNAIHEVGVQTISKSTPEPILEAAVATVANEISEHDQSATGSNELEDEPRPEPKYKVFQTVYARDTDGVMYEAVVRRRLYGQNQRKQVQMGLVTSEQEALEILAQEEELTWHYFVHYNNWNVNWDRWVKEDNVFPVSDKVKELARAIANEHRALKQELKRKSNGRKAQQKVDGVEFLRLWRLRKAKLEEEVDLLRGEPDGITPKANLEHTKNALLRKADGWTKAAVAMEMQLRKKNLTRAYQHANLIDISFALKKILLEHWEIIGQCEMVLALPAAVSVREALTAYLATKGVIWDINEKSKCNTTKREPIDGITKKEDLSFIDAPQNNVDSASETLQSKEKSENVAFDENFKPAKITKSELSLQKEWLVMAEGIALLFDQAIPYHLLYPEEIPQLNVFNSDPVFCRKRYCEIYGCGHLLRLFVRLPELVMDELSEAEARPVFAKINDFLRYLNKNHETMLAQSYRKPNDSERKGQTKSMKDEDKKRKVLHNNNVEYESVVRKPRNVETTAVNQPI